MKEIIRQAKEINEIAKEKGWWKNGRSNDTIFMLVLTELAEAIEADREDLHANLEDFKKDQLEGDGSQELFKQHMESYIRGTVEEELADAYIRILDYLYFNKGEYFIIPEYDAVFERSFADEIFRICKEICDYRINNALFLIMKYAEHLDIDLNTFVDLKIRYNRGREYMHGGKKY